MPAHGPRQRVVEPLKQHISLCFTTGCVHSAGGSAERYGLQVSHAAIHGGDMLAEALITLAASGGTAVVQAAGTDAWNGLREAVARWFGRGDEAREHAELERLDRTAIDLGTAAPGEMERVRSRQEAAWQARFEILLESLDEPQRGRLAAALQDLLAQHLPETRGVSVGADGVAVGGNITNTAAQGSIAATGWRTNSVS